MSAEPRRLGPVLLAVLLAAALAVGALVYRARTPDLALEVPRIERDLRLGADGDAGTAQIRFFVRFDEPAATVQIVGTERRPVRTLTQAALAENREVVCAWDGRDDAGELVAPGHYRLRVLAPDADRDMVYPRRMDARGGKGVVAASDAEGGDALLPADPCAPAPAASG